MPTEMSMSLLIQAAHISFAHAGNQIFDDVSFELREGDRIALVGENGSGKSTLFRLLGKLLDPDRGAVTHRRNLTIGFLEQDPMLDSASTAYELASGTGSDPEVLERALERLEERLGESLGDDEMAVVLDQYNDVLARLDRAEEREPGAETSRILAGLRLPERLWHLPVGRLSGGEQKLVAIAAFFAVEPDILLLDEPDNHLDIEAKRWLESYLASYKGVVGLITHDRYMIDRVANKIVELEDGKIRVYPGGYSAFQRQKRERLERDATLRALQVREFSKLKASAEQLTQWARQNPKFASRAENQRRKLAEERDRLEQTPAPVLDRHQIKVEFGAERGGTMVLQAESLSQVFDNHVVFEPFDLVIRHGERIGLIGPNGAGKTTLVQIVRGDVAPTSGSLRVGSSIQPGYFSQQHETLDDAKTPLELVREIKEINEQQALSFLMGMLFDRDDAMRTVSELSGGERSRLQIALLIAAESNFLLLDEPTNNLDISSVEALEEALLEFPGALLAISHDRFFLERICTRIIEMRDRLVRDYAGPFSFFESNPKMGALLTRMKPVEPETQKGRRNRTTSKAINV